jgi:NitT/TauT family transport system permease protein
MSSVSLNNQVIRLKAEGYSYKSYWEQMMSARSAQFNQLLLRSSGIIFFLLLWETAARLRWVDPYFLPPISAVLLEIPRIFADGNLISNLVISSVRGIGGLLMAMLIGLPLGFILSRRFVSLAEAIGPLLRVLSQVNPFLLMMAFTLFFGYGETAKFAVIAWVSLWPMLFYTITAVRNVDPLQLKTATSLAMSERDLLVKVFIPSALPTIFVGIRISAGLTFFILIAVEMLSAVSGLGWFVHNSAMNFEIIRMYAGATVIVITGFLLNRFLMAQERNLFSWKEPALFACGEKARARKRSWRPRPVTALAFTALLVILLVTGGHEIYKVNARRNAELAGPEEGRHSRHLGSAVDEVESGK